MPSWRISGYLHGVMYGVAVATVVAVIWGTSRYVRSAPAGEIRVAILPALIDLDESWIFPGDSREFEVQLANLSQSDVSIDGLRFSCPCAKGHLGNFQTFPVQLPAKTRMPIRITIDSNNDESGPVELRFGVVGHAGDQLVDVGGVASFVFVQHLNAEPRALSGLGFGVRHYETSSIVGLCV